MRPIIAAVVLLFLPSCGENSAVRVENVSENMMLGEDVTEVHDDGAIIGDNETEPAEGLANAVD